jgi:hypothetical protein
LQALEGHYCSDVGADSTSHFVPSFLAFLAVAGRLCGSLTVINNMNYLDTHLGRLQIFNYPFNKGNLQVVQLPGSEAFYIAEFVPAGTFASPSQLIGALGTPSTQTGAGQTDRASSNAPQVSAEVKTALRNASITVLNLLAVGFSYYTIFHDDTNSYCGGPGQSYYWAVWLFCAAHLVPCVLDFQSSVTPIIQLLTDGHFQYILLGFVGLTSYPTAWRTYHSKFGLANLFPPLDTL